MAHFQSLEASDTVFVPIDYDWEPTDTIPIADLVGSLPDTLLTILGGFGLEDEVVSEGGWRVQLDEGHDLCLVNQRESWFVTRNGLIYDRQAGAFTGLAELAYFIGGEGSQIIAASWLFDADADGDLDLLTRYLERYYRPWIMDEDSAEVLIEGVGLKYWTPQGYQEGEVSDSAALIRAFPVDWGW